MKFRLQKLPKYCGKKAQVYSPVILDTGVTETLFETFVRQFISDYRTEMEDIDDTLKTYGHLTGFSRHKNKGNRLIEYEGEELGDGIVAICNLPKKLFRLYAIVYVDYVAILGGGGRKPGAGLLKNYEETHDTNAKLIRIRKILDAAELAGDFKAKDSGIISTTNLIYDSKNYE